MPTRWVEDDSTDVLPPVAVVKPNIGRRLVDDLVALCNRDAVVEIQPSEVIERDSLVIPTIEGKIVCWLVNNREARLLDDHVLAVEFADQGRHRPSVSSGTWSAATAAPGRPWSRRIPEATISSSI